MDLQTFDYQSLETLVSEKTGLRLDKDRYGEIGRTLNAILDEAGLRSFEALRLALAEREATDPLWRQLIDRITIGETYFFRDSAQCSVLQSVVLPELIARRRAAGFRHLSLWSAGCATGEEPYTLAIMLRELIPDIADWTFAILGTDINLTSLETARRGIYKARSFREETRPDVQTRWFTAHGNQYEIDPAVRKMVEFAPLNLVSGSYPSFESRTMSLDLIICRNVTIYFEEPTTRRIIGRFHQALNEEGWLVTGHAEPLVLAYPGYAPRNFRNAVLYQKQPESPVVITTQAAVAIQTAPVTPPKLDEPVPANALQEARTAAGREDWKAVLRWLLVAEREDRMNPQVHYLRGLMLLQTGKPDGALMALRQAIYCDPSFALAHYALGDLYEQRGDYEAARRCWLLSQQTIAHRQPDNDLVPGEDLTVEMFSDLLNYRLSKLSDGG